MGSETEPIRMCALLQERKRNDAAPECGAEGKWLLSSVEKAQHRAPAEPDPPAAERHCSMVWCGADDPAFDNFFYIVSGSGMGEGPSRAGMLSFLSLSVKMCSTLQPRGMVLLTVSGKKHPGKHESDTWGSGVGDKKDLRPLIPPLKRRFWQLMKGFDLFRKWLVLKNSSSRHPDWQCWVGCSKVKSLPHIRPQKPHWARGSLWLHSNLGQNIPVTQGSLRSSWIVL